jgi:hypothetical protein
MNLTDLRRGQKFIGPDGRTHEVTTPASDHPHGFVEVRDLSMTDAEAAALLAAPGAVERGCDPREGFFAFTHPVDVEVIG